MAANIAVTNSPRPLIPPEESLWQKYSSHYELPLAGATSVFLHGAIVGVLVILTIGLLFSANVEATKPPKMDVVMIEGGGAGFEGLGGEQGLPGAPDAGNPKRTEQLTPQAPNERPEMRQPPRLLKDQPIELGLPLIDDGTPPLPDDLALELAKIAKEADVEVKKEMKLPTTEPGTEFKKTGPIGSGNPKGVGGLGGAGGGPGAGNKQGAGTGKGGFGGRKATKQEIYAMRWHFDLSGDPREHARKLAAIGVTLAIPDPAGGFLVITDLNRRPVDPRRDNLMGFQEAVKWYNTKPDSVQSLARELQLPFVPRYVVLLLSRDREEKMAEAEKQFAAQNRRDLKSVSMTRFDFRLHNGAYDPTVIQQK